MITEENLGAWLLKCNPSSQTDLNAAIAAGGHTVTQWCVAPGYRSEMMAPGDEVVFWVSGNGRILARGVWGIGRVVDRVHASGTVAVDLPLFDEAVTAGDLRAAQITDLEVLRLPRGPNPSWVSKQQMAAMERLLRRDPRLTGDSDGCRGVQRLTTIGRA
jgi:EVE domain-containing protein